MKNFSPVLLVAFFTGAAVHAQPASELDTVVTGCATLEVARERHACFDAATAHLRNAGDEEAAVPSAEAEEGLQSGQAIAEFGARRARVDATDDGAGILHDRIAQLEERQPGQFLITLESGQVWYQTIANSYLRLRKGMDIEIALSTFGGAYRLSAKGANGFIQVTRIE